VPTHLLEPLLFQIKGVLLGMLAASAIFSPAIFSSGANFSFVSSSTSTSSSSSAAGQDTISIVNCTNGTCTVTMGGSGTTVGIFDTTISFGSISDGRATLRVDDQDVTCAAGQTVTAGSLTLACTDVTADTVSFTATPR